MPATERICSSEAPNRSSPGRVHVSYRTFSHAWAFHPYIDNRERIFALIRLATLSEEATSDLRDMLSKRLTFAQALAPDNTSILRVQKSRLFRVKQAVWPQMERVV